MATSRGLGRFSKRMRIVANNFNKNVDRTVRRAGVAAITAMDTTSPVDTGLFRGNNQVTFGAPAAAPTERMDTSGQDLAAKSSKMSKWQLGKSGSIFITNALPYAQRINDGWSQQAPRGVTRFAVAAARRELRKGKLI